MDGTRHDAKDQRLDERGRKGTVGKDENPGIFAPQAKYTAMISLLVTALIAHFLLFDAMFQDGQLVWHLVAMHYVVPAMSVLDWLLFDVVHGPRGRLGRLRAVRRRT